MTSTSKIALTATLLALMAGPAVAEIMNAPATLRSGPGVRHAALASLPRGTLLQSTTCRAGWCRAQWRGEWGYVPSAVVVASGPGAARTGPWPRRGYGYSNYPEYWEGRFGRNEYRPSHGVWASGSILD